MNNDHRNYLKFTNKSRLDKAINTLAGIIEGVTIDAIINDKEIGFLNMWLNEHRQYHDQHPFNELIPECDLALSDGVLTSEEKENILWLCRKLQSTEYYDMTTAGIQRLHAILGGIIADGIITQAELTGLSNWIAEHDYLRSSWPYDEVDSLITTVLSDGKISNEEHKLLLDFFAEFTALFDDKTITNPSINTEHSVSGLCAVCPQIQFENSIFCFTGASSKFSRAEFTDLVRSKGGKAVPGVSAKINYLVIGSDGNPCWSYACYGRKVEKAVELRKKGKPLQIVHEHDFLDAIADNT